MMQSNSISGLEGQLQSAQSGMGPDGDDWYVPPPTAAMDRYTLETTLDKLYDMKANIEGVIKPFLSSIFRLSSTVKNGQAMIAIFDTRIQEYTAALNKLNQPAPTPQPQSKPIPITEPTPIPLPTTQQPEPDPGQAGPLPVEGKKTNWLLYVGIGTAAWLLTRKKKQAVKGVSNETIAVAGLAALFLLSRKKETTPVTAPPITIAEGEEKPIYVPGVIKYPISTYLR